MGNSSVHPLTWAAVNGDLARLQQLMSETENWADVKDRNGDGLLHSAAWKNRVEVAEYLTANGINIELRNDKGETPFLVACQYESAALVDLLISKRCNRLAETTSGRGALTLAVIAGQFEMTKKLVEMGFDVNKSRDEEGNTSLHWAAAIGSVQIATFLIDNGANLEAKAKFESTPIMITVQNNELEVFHLLISKGSDVRATDDIGYGLLHSAAWRNRLKIARHLIAIGMNIEHRSNLGETPFLVACKRGYAAFVDLLISKGCNRFAVNNSGGGALTMAVTARQFEMTKKLVEMGFDINKPYLKDGLTSLHCAVAIGSVQIVTFLIDNGANLEAKTKFGSTPIMMAVRRNNLKVFHLLVSKGSDVRTNDRAGHGLLHWAAMTNCLKMAEHLIANGSNIELRSDNGYTSLHWAILKENIQIVKFLIDQGANVEAKTKSGKTPIMCAVSKGNVDILNLLISRGCNVRAKDECGHGLLVAAVRGKRVGMFKTVFRMGFDVNETCRNGRTCLHWAAVYDSADVAALLLEHGADLEPRAKRGRTPFLLAVARGSNNVARLLSTKGCNIHAKDEEGHGAFDLAWANHQYDTIPFLLSKFDYLNEEGAPMLHWAAHNDYRRMAALLILHGVDLEAKDEWGCTPFLTAVEFGSDNTIDLLISKKCNIFATTLDGASALDLAVMGGRIDLFRRFAIAGITTDYFKQETRDFLAKLVTDGNEEASKYLKEVEAPLHVLREKLDVVSSEPESKRDDLRDDLSRALGPETNAAAAVDGGRVAETAPESSLRAQPAFAVSACTESSCIVQ